MKNKSYGIELVWNREFNWCQYGNVHDDLKSVKATAISIRDSSDGARVKKIRVIDCDTDKVVWRSLLHLLLSPLQ